LPSNTAKIATHRSELAVADARAIVIMVENGLRMADSPSDYDAAGPRAKASYFVCSSTAQGFAWMIDLATQRRQHRTGGADRWATFCHAKSKPGSMDKLGFSLERYSVRINPAAI